MTIICLVMFFARNKKSLALELLGLHFSNPVGIFRPADSPKKCPRRFLKAGFLTLEPPQNGILEWISQLQAIREKTLLAVNLSTDILHSFSLVYDFADILIIDPCGEKGLQSRDVADISSLLDEIVNLRLCYEAYTPVFLRLLGDDSPQEIHSLVSCARLAGLDGLVAPGEAKVRLAMEECQHRMPVIGMATSPEEAILELQAGALLTETQMRPLAMAKLIKYLKNTTPETI